MAKTSSLHCLGKINCKLSLSNEAKSILIPINESDFLTNSGQFYLYFEGITGQGLPAILSLYINVPDGVEASDKYKFASISTYGIELSSTRSKHSHGRGLNHTIELGDVLKVLYKQETWRENEIKITLKPKRNLAKSSTVIINQVSLLVNQLSLN